MDNHTFSVKSFYSVRTAQSYLQDNSLDDDVDDVDIVELPPPVNDLTDEEDFDNDILDDENRDPNFLPPDFVGTVELHHGNVNEMGNEDVEHGQNKNKFNPIASWEKIMPSYEKFGQATDGANKKEKS